MRRRAAGALALAAAAGCGGGAGGDGSAHAELPRGRHNVVLFLVDTLRADRLGPYGGEAPTPRLDALAAESLVFERCVAQSTWTKPTTASILTGLYPHAHGANYGRSVLPDTVDTLAEILGERGYRTAAIGYNPHVFGQGLGFDQGFDVFEPIEPPEVRPFPRGGRVIDAALEWLAGAPDDEPFLLYLHLLDPHFPFEPPGYEGRGLTVFLDVEEDDRERALELYDLEIAYVDAQLGRVLDALEERGLDERTLFVFVADHGEELWEHGRFGHGDAQMVPQVTRVPLIVRPPGLPPELRGTRHAGVVEQVDVLATVADALGLPARRAGAGTSLLARALRPDPPARRHALIETEDVSVGKAIVGPEWKYVRRWTPAPSEELYHLGEDPGETEDRAAEEPEIVAAMRAALAAEMSATAPVYELALENDGEEETTVAGRIETTEAPIELVRLEDLEVDPEAPSFDGPFDAAEHEEDGGRRHEATFLLRLSPGDRDVLRFRPHASEAVCRVELFADGEPLAPERVLLGADGAHPPAVPFELVAAESHDLAAPGDPPPAPRDGLVARLRLCLRTSNETAERSARDAAVLEALGYAGDD